MSPNCIHRFKLAAALPVLLVFALQLQAAALSSSPISLTGEWRFALDRDDRGISDAWFGRVLPDRLKLPGALQSQDFGDEISIQTPWVLSLYDRSWFLREDYHAYTNAGNVKVPFVCQPPRHYLGAAWYQREIEIPAEWDGRRVVLFLERPHWESRVWLNDRFIGTNNSLCVAHDYELGLVNAPSNSLLANLPPGRHTITVRVDNRLILPYRPDAHAISDSLNNTWNGIAGTLELRSTPAVWLEDVQIFPDQQKESARVRVVIGNATGRAATNLLSLNFIPRLAAGGGKPFVTEIVCTSVWTTIEANLESGYPVKSWDEFDPQLFELTAHLRPGDSSRPDSMHLRRIQFGFRDFKRAGTQLVMNGRETHLRGTHHGGDFPLTGYPATDVDYWRQLIRTCQEWGQNHMRFHSFCPPEAAFQAADELGFYLQPEPGMWNTFDPAMERMLHLETERMIKAYGNHPSFVMFAASNEPKGRWKQILPAWAEHFRAIDPRRLYTTGTGFTDSDAPGPMDKVDFTITQRFGSRPVRRESGWFGRDYAASMTGVSVPVIGHEIGQWCAYPDFGVIKKFLGYMRPGNFDIFRDSAIARGVAKNNRDLAWASGRFQLACYKEEIEANLRTPGMAGFQLLDLHDYVGQGTALVGLLDPFWENKGYVTAEEFRRFCSRTVPLARLRQRVFTTDDKLEAEVELAHFGAHALTNSIVRWEIRDAAGRLMAKDEFTPRDLPIGRSAVGRISFEMAKLPAPAAYKLVVRVEPRFAYSVLHGENDWSFWLYPARDSKPMPSDVLVTSSWDEAEVKLAAGGKVLFLPPNTVLDWSCPPLDDVPVFWNRLMNPGWSRMLGLWCDTNHPALAAFPTEPNCDWQWTQIVRGVRPMNLEKLPRELQPIVQGIDDWNRNWKLGAVFECKVGSGRLLVSTFDLANDSRRRPVARQLYRSLIDYMASDRFQPKVAVSAAGFRSVLFDTQIMRKLGARVAGERDAANVIDGDPNTIWVAGARGRNATGSRHPHVLAIEFPQPVAFSGLMIMPRQNDRDHTGDIREFELESSDDGAVWTSLKRGSLASTWNPQRVELGKVVSAKHLRFTAISGFGNDTSAALGELAVLYAGPRLTNSATGNIEFRRSRSTSADVDEGVPVRPQ